MTGYHSDNDRKNSAHETDGNAPIHEQSAENAMNIQEQNDGTRKELTYTEQSKQAEEGHKEPEKSESNAQNVTETGLLEENPQTQSRNESSTEEQKEGTPEPKIVRETEIVEEYEEKTAGFWIRFWAFIIDGLVVSAVVGILVKPIFYLFGWDVGGSLWYSPFTIISGIIYYAYFVIMTKYWQQTIGKMIFGIKVKSLKEEKLSWTTVLFRELVSRFINNTVWISYLAVAFTPKNQGLQDFFADTIVVQENVYVKNEKKVIKEKIIETNSSNEQTA